jgi:DNA-binding NtrC family response regulator
LDYDSSGTVRFGVSSSRGLDALTRPVTVMNDARSATTETDQDRNVTESSPKVSARHRVLIVDDEPALLEALKVALERSTCAVTACRAFDEARQQLLAEEFDVLITDVRLGAFNGIQLAVVARDRNPRMKIVVFSGYDDPVLRAEASNLGAIYLVKPITAEQLLQFIEDCTDAR